jgi:hypothetical protein
LMAQTGFGRIVQERRTFTITGEQGMVTLPKSR